jgi:tRNA (cytidine/uridine-2'-O-)-methyltransferase
VLHIALLEPEIPPNTGNIARLTAATHSQLHLIGKLGYKLDDASLKRAGIDYWPHVNYRLHADLAAFEAFWASINSLDRIWAVECPAPRPHTAATFRDGDCLLFGCESRGLPADVRAKYASQMIQIPMFSPHVRSLNLSTSVGIVAYEALRQLHNW